MKLWLDDIRPAPPGWEWVKTVKEAQELLLTGTVTEASLDHDLGDDEKFGTGYKLVCWMEETGIWPTESTKVHSANPVGWAKMFVPIKRYYQCM